MVSGHFSLFRLCSILSPGGELSTARFAVLGLAVYFEQFAFILCIKHSAIWPFSSRPPKCRPFPLNGDFGRFSEKTRFEKQDASNAPSGAYKCFRVRKHLAQGGFTSPCAFQITHGFQRIPKRKDTQSVSFLFGGDTQIWVHQWAFKDCYLLFFCADLCGL